MNGSAGKFFLIIILMASVVLTGGCGFKDIDKRVFVVAVGVDGAKSKKNPYRITLKLAIPSGAFKDAPKPNYSYLTIESPTLAEGIRILKTHTDKEIDFSHTKIIVLGENIIQRNTEETFDLFLRRRDFQGISWVAVGDPSAEKVLKTQPSSEMPGSNALFNLFSNEGTESAYIVTTYLYDFSRRLLEEGMDPILPVIKVNKKEDEYRTNHAIILKNIKEQLKLNKEQTKYYNILADKQDKVDIIVDKKDVHFAVAANSVKVHYKILTPPKQPPILKMDVKVIGVIEESAEPLAPEKLALYSKYASEEKEKRLTGFLKMLQKNGVDPIGFGIRYKATRLHTRETFADWKRLYPQMTFDVNVNVVIKSTGMIH